MTEKTPEKLAIEAQNNPNAFGEIIDLFQNALLRYVLRLGNFARDEAEDIVSESFLKAWKNLNDFDDHLKFSSWIYRIAHNEAISAFRKNRARGAENRVDFDEDIFGNLAGKRDLEKEMDQKMDSEKIRTLLEKMPEKDRTILVLFYLEEKNYEEISDILQIPAGTVATLLYRAKKKFRSMVQDSFPLEK